MTLFLLLVGVFALLHIPVLRALSGGSRPADKAAIAMAAMFAVTGVLHFTHPAEFVAMVPDALPAAEALVAVSGAVELLVAGLLLVPRARTAAGWGTVALLVAIWPANISVAAIAATSGDLPPELDRPTAYYLLRVPFQVLFIGWAAWIALGRLPGRTLRRRVFAHWYDKLTRRYEAWIVDRRRALLADVAGNVVELGPGTGANLPHFGDDVTSWTGIEPNPAMRAQLAERAASLGRDVRFAGLDGNRIDLPDDCADVVVCTLVLCSVPDTAATLAEARRLLRPGGRFVFMEHVAAPEYSKTRRTQRRIEPLWSFFADGCRTTCETQKMIESAGFTNVDVEQFDVPEDVAPFWVAPHISGFATTY